MDILLDFDIFAQTLNASYILPNKYYATKISDSVRGLCVPDKGLGGYGMVNLRAHLG